MRTATAPTVRAALTALAVFAATGCADDPGGPDGDGEPDDDACVIAVVGSDYASTTIATLTEDGRRCRQDVINSGSRPPGVVTALSGDVVFPSTADPAGRLVLIDRYPNAVLTFATIDAAGALAVDAQLSVATGFSSNPHDVAFLGGGRAYVTRFASNLDPTPFEGDFDEGGDLLIIEVDAPGPAIVGRVDLRHLAGEEQGVALSPRPDRVAIVDGVVWVGLAHLSTYFDRGGPGLVAAVDPVADEVVEVVTLDGLENCGHVAAAPDGAGLWAGCAGVFAEGADSQRAHQGLAWIDTAVSPPAVTRVAEGVAFGWALAPLPDGRALVTEFGQQGGAPDRLLLVDRRGGEPVDLGVSTAAFELTALAISDDAGVLLVADARPEAPRIRRFELAAATLGRELESVVPSPGVGLPPRHLFRFR